MTIYQIRKQKNEIVHQYYVVSELILTLHDLKVLCKEPKLEMAQVKTVGDFSEQVRILTGSDAKLILTKAMIETAPKM